MSWMFLKNFFSNPGATGAIAESSQGLAELITETALLEKADSVVEFGPGTGVFTEKIIQKIGKTTLFFAIEINPVFAEATRKRCPNCQVYCDSAANAAKFLEKAGKKQCDCVISGLPWAAFPEALQNELLDAAADILKPGGRFLTFAYLQGMLMPAAWSFRRKLKQRFASVTTTRTVWMNLPPAFVYCATK